MIVVSVGMLATAFRIQSVKAASGTIYINSDGSITPSTANITTSDNITYTFDDNNYLPIVVNRSNIIINGRDHTLQTSPTTENGFSLSRVNNVTIKNTTIINNDKGVYINSSSSNTVSGNNITNNLYGVCVISSSSNTVSGNNITNSFIGIDLESSSDNNVLSGNNVTTNGRAGIEISHSSDNNTLSGNNAKANGYGIYLSSSSGNVLFGNVMASNTYNFGVYGNVLSDFVNHVDTSNLVDDKPVYYLINQSNIKISPQAYPDVGYLSLVNCKNVTVQGLTLTKTFQGLLLAFTTDSKITDNNITANNVGIALSSSSFNTLSGNNVAANGYGIYLSSSSGNVLFCNNVAANSEFGIWLYSSCDNNTLSGNNVGANGYDGIYLSSSSNNDTLSGNDVTANSYDGVVLDTYSDNNTLSDNNVANSEEGIDIWSYSDTNVLSGNNVTENTIVGIDLSYSFDNTLSGNNITANWYGIYLGSSSNNRIFHNYFLNNEQQTYLGGGSINMWNDGYPSGGNYWSNYAGVDLKNGLYQNQTGSDGIGDTPYVIDANNTDHYPLMGAFHTYLVRFHGPPFNNVTVISNSTITDFLTVTSFENQEAVAIEFNVTGKQGSAGFCRVSIPTAIMNGTYTVFVNGTEIPFTLLPCSNASVSYLYFTYRHSTEQVAILPEFPPSNILPLFIIITLLGAMILKRKQNIEE